MVAQASSAVIVGSVVANAGVKVEVIEGSKQTFFNKINLIMPSYLLKDSQNINNRTFKYWLNKPNSTDKHDLLVYVKSSMLSIELIQTNGSKMLVNCKDDVTVTLVSNNELKLTSSEKTEFFTCWRNTTDSKLECKSIETTEITLYFKPNNDNNNFEYL